MADSQRDMLEHRHLRDAAKRLLREDMGSIGSGVRNHTIGDRVKQRARHNAQTVSQEAEQFLRDNSGKIGASIAIIAGAVTTFLFRDKIANAVHDLLHRGEDNDDRADPMSGDGAAHEDLSEQDCD